MKLSLSFQLLLRGWFLQTFPHPFFNRDDDGCKCASHKKHGEGSRQEEIRRVNCRMKQDCQEKAAFRTGIDPKVRLVYWLWVVFFLVTTYL